MRIDSALAGGDGGDGCNAVVDRFRGSTCKLACVTGFCAGACEGCTIG